MEKKDLISKKLIGRRLDGIPKRVIITNIYQIYAGILKKSKLINQSRGFYECSLINLNKNKYLIIKITPGNVIIDILKLIRDNAGEIVLIGLAGSLNNNYKIGNVVFPNVVTSQEKLNKKIVINKKVVNGSKVCQTDGLLKDRSFYISLVKKRIDFVDMESFSLACFCLENKIKTRIVSIISDMPLNRPFYLKESYFKKNFNNILNNLINNLL